MKAFVGVSAICAATTALADWLPRDLVASLVVDCWLVDPGSNAAHIALTLNFRLDGDGRVVAERTDLIAHTAAEPDDIDIAYHAAHRAVMRCGGQTGFALPGLDENGQRVTISFDPIHGMRSW